MPCVQQILRKIDNSGTSHIDLGGETYLPPQPATFHMLINGQCVDTISALDRGLLYGDGVFESILIEDHQPNLLNRHMRRLIASCQRLKIEIDEQSVIENNVLCFLADQPADGVLKIIVTRGIGGRGYAVQSELVPTRILQFHGLPDGLDVKRQSGVEVQLCHHRLSQNKCLAGLKHLNRLDQVMASLELRHGIDEGLMLDEAGNVIEGIKSNLFIVREDKILTSPLDHCGVKGIVRDYLIEQFCNANRKTGLKLLNLADITNAAEVFVCNSIIGVWPVIKLIDDSTVWEWAIGPVTRQAQAFLSTR